MHRAVIFTDVLAPAPAVLLEATLATVTGREDIEVVAVCAPRAQAHARVLWRYFARKLPLFCCAADVAAPPRRCRLPRLPDLARLARRHRFALLDPPGGRINDSHFIDRLRREFRPTLALSYYSQQKFGAELLGLFRHAVNYHNGQLPFYRGLKATSWSIYHGEAQTGFTFHRMTSGIDEGPILIEGAIPVDLGSNAADLDHEKAEAAACQLPRLLQMVLGGEPGRPQEGAGNYFSKNDWQALTVIADPAALSSAELARRLRAFNSLRLQIDGRWRKVNRLRRRSGRFSGSPRGSFTTADGIVLAPVRCRRVPFALWSAARWLAQRWQVESCPTAAP